MIAPFEFSTATRIVFGWGTFAQAGKLARELGRHILVVTGRDVRRAAPLLDLLRSEGLGATVFAVPGEPTLDLVSEGVEVARRAGCDAVVSLGGGSAMDAGKAIAAMLPNPGELLDYVEIVGRGQPLPLPPAPFMAVPTTAGTGTEVTRNAVLVSVPHRVKVSLRSPLMLARIALVDPALTCGLPPALTANTGLDALTQLIEPYVSCRANPMMDALCAEGIRRAARALPVAFADGANREAREEMALASLFGGLALANAGLGAVHGFAAPIGGLFPDAPHGAVCAVLLPLVMAANLKALAARAPGSAALCRYQDVARWLTSDASASAADGVAWVDRLVKTFGIPKLGRYGIQPADIELLVENAARANSMKGNPLVLTTEELAGILTDAI